MSRLDAEALRTRHADLGAEVTDSLSASSPQSSASSSPASAAAEIRIEIPADRARELLTRLRDDEASAVRRLVDLTVIDRAPATEPRFEVVYRLYSVEFQTAIRVHSRLLSEAGDDAEAATADSVVSLWPSADWLEREAFDLFGIVFQGHPDLRRLLLEADYEGAPLRKTGVPDSPVSGAA